MTNFCTLFDSNYLTRGLALYRSLETNSSSFHLYVVAFNQQCYDYLKAVEHPHLTVINLPDFEDAELLKVKPTRSPAEYCWTCTPSIILYCIEKYNLPSCTYIDADMIFYQDPEILIREMGTKSVLITEHRYTKTYDQSKESGRYCVQFMFFRNNTEGMSVLRWWRDRCIEWCYARIENGKFGDQKYLDDWTERFEGVHVLQHLGGGVAPWNIQKYVPEIRDNKIHLLYKETASRVPLVFYHFHGVKFYTDNVISCCGPVYELSKRTKELIYFPYFQQLVTEEEHVKNHGFTINPNGAQKQSPTKKQLFLEFLRDSLKLFTLGKLSVYNLNPFNFKRKHFHLYKTD